MKQLRPRFIVVPSSARPDQSNGHARTRFPSGSTLPVTHPPLHLFVKTDTVHMPYSEQCFESYHHALQKKPVKRSVFMVYRPIFYDLKNQPVSGFSNLATSSYLTNNNRSDFSL
jgi:hypothetical protein